MGLREARARCYRSRANAEGVEVQIAHIAHELSSDLRALAAAIRSAVDKDIDTHTHVRRGEKEQRMWADVVVRYVCQKSAVNSGKSPVRP
jgi:hypothetical protein